MSVDMNQAIGVFKQIVKLGGNISEEQLTDTTGNGKFRGRLYCAARAAAKQFLKDAGVELDTPNSN